MKPRVDRTRWPVMLVTWHGAMEEDEVDPHFDEMTEVARAAVRDGSRFVVVMNMAHFGRPSIPQRRYAATRLSKLYQEMGDRLVGVAHFSPSLITRGVLRALYWFAPPPFPTHVTNDLDAAFAWAERRIERSGVSSAS